MQRASTCWTPAQPIAGASALSAMAGHTSMCGIAAEPLVPCCLHACVCQYSMSAVWLVISGVACLLCSASANSHQPLVKTSSADWVPVYTRSGGWHRLARWSSHCCWWLWWPQHPWWQMLRSPPARTMYAAPSYRPSVEHLLDSTFWSATTQAG
jgi:hypothetical protein